MRRLSATLIATAAIAALPATAGWAQGGDNSSVDQYTESVPTAGGGNNGGNDSGGNPNAIPPSTQRQLSSEGSAGQAAADLAESAAPTVTTHPVHKKSKAGNSKRDKRHTAAAFDISHPGGGSPAGHAVNQAVSGDSGGGIGIALPIILAASLLAAIAVVVARRRAPGTGKPQAS